MKILRVIVFLILLLPFFGVKVYAQSPLCSSYPTNFCCEYVASVTINGQTYAGSNGYTAGSGGTGPNGYYDYTSGTPVPTINAGDNITISYTALTNGNYMEYFKLWVDFNGNGVLSDPGEQVYAYNVSWLGTKTVNSTFQVPTTVFNGPVYMRFMMVYANVPALCGSYAYGNTFDFVTNITGAVDPFNHSGTIYGGNGDPLAGVNLNLYKSNVGTNSFSLHGSYQTDLNGNYSITTSLDANSYDFRLEIPTITVSNPSNSDAIFFNTKILTQNFSSVDFYRMDVNDDNKLTISDVFLIFAKINRSSWIVQPPNYKIFNETEWNTIVNSSSNLKSSVTGSSSILINNLQTSSSTNFYVARPGLKN